MVANFKQALGVLFVALVALLSLSLPVAESQELSPAIAIAEGKSQQGYPYLSGGVSSDERDAMEERGKAYNVRLAFAEKTGAYLSDVRLVIEGIKNVPIVETITNGPWFFINLPVGAYTVKATFNGQTKEIRNLRVTESKTVRRTLHWDLGEQIEAVS